MAAEKAIVLVSGGLNSAVAAAMARQDHPALAMLHVRLGHRAQEKETALFEKLAAHYEVREQLVLDMPHFAEIGGNARVSRKMQLQDALAINGGPSHCYVRGMVGSLIMAAFAWAGRIDAKRIYIGVAENLGPPAPPTATLYPDFSRESVQLFNHLCATASPEQPVAVSAPLMDLGRAEIVKLGRRMGVPFELTWSCLSSGTAPCGACVGCATRSRGFLDASAPDPVMLEAQRDASAAPAAVAIGAV
jgi:7-cyano-7-deazaguanine synthase